MSLSDVPPYAPGVPFFVTKEGSWPQEKLKRTFLVPRAAAADCRVYALQAGRGRAAPPKALSQDILYRLAEGCSCACFLEHSV